MTIQNKKETGVSLVRETVINKLLPMFKKWNDETHKEVDGGHFFSQSPKWGDSEIELDGEIEEILAGIVFGKKDVEEVLKQYLPEHSLKFNYTHMDEMWGDLLEDFLDTEIDLFTPRWDDWKNSESYKEIYDLLDKYPKPINSIDRETIINQLQSIFEGWSDKTFYEKDRGRLIKEPLNWGLHLIQSQKITMMDDILRGQWVDKVLKDNLLTLIEKILNSEDLDKILKDNLPRYSWERLILESDDYTPLSYLQTKVGRGGFRTPWSYDIEFYLKERIEEEIDRVSPRWDDWKETVSYKEIHQVLTQIQNDYNWRLKGSLKCLQYQWGQS